MQSLLALMRLGLDGLLLDATTYRAQRDDPEGLRRGVLLVALIGLIVGLAGWIGSVGEYLTSPNLGVVIETMITGLLKLPLIQELINETPELNLMIEQMLSQAQFTSGGPFAGILAVLLTPLFFLLRWLIVGAVAHLAARAFGGRASFGQTLAATALASGAGLLAAVEVVPYAQVAATGILGLMATAVAVHEVHELGTWRTVAAVTIGPILLIVLVSGLFCCGLFALINAAG